MSNPDGGATGNVPMDDSVTQQLQSVGLSSSAVAERPSTGAADGSPKAGSTRSPTSGVRSVAKTAFGMASSNVERAQKVAAQRIIDVNDESLEWGPTQVIIDIDDTVKSSGGYKLFNVPLGGVDTQYGRGELYPGSFQFLLELAMYKMGKNRKPLRLAVLTTRIPQVPITVDSALNMRLREVAEKRGVLNWGIDCDHKIQYSTIKEWVFNETRGEKKFVNFRKLHKHVCKENSNARFIWIGDTGDRDLEAGEMMINFFPGKIRAVFMHCVTPEEAPEGHRMPNDYYLKSVPVLFFRTYVGAAKKAVEHGLLNHNALSRVLVRAVLDLNENNTQDLSKWKDLIKDILEVEEIANLKRYEANLVVKTRVIIENKIKELSQYVQV
ncbi:uncharacterized protein BcabD6B2_45940 [Babesia caballi]|uniref:Phosphatidate phosphatase APP1 catalytic domain-containing protein n=1 Tax=Babesia caballi TaxID=5871 RepID=A0AAV4M2V3_BABCB|nr:hypothetical protein, conserved [Babesia caballi]